MILTPELIHYAAAGLGISIAAIGAGLGLGNAGFGIQESLTRQPTGNAQNFNLAVIGLALIESGAIIALVATLITLFSGVPKTIEVAYAELGIGLAVGCAAAAISISSSFVVRAAANAVARQPLFSSKILTFMLISQSIIEAPAIFAFIIGLSIRAQLSDSLTIYASIKLLAAGLVVALGCIGPSIGQAIFTRAVCTSIGLNKNVYNKLFPFALINAAMIETPMIFCVLFALLMSYANTQGATFVTAMQALAATIAMGLGSLGCAIGIGYVASRSCYQIALDPTVYTLLARTTLLAVVLIESSMIYALIIAMLLLGR